MRASLRSTIGCTECGDGLAAYLKALNVNFSPICDIKRFLTYWRQRLSLEGANHLGTEKTPENSLATFAPRMPPNIGSPTLVKLFSQWQSIGTIEAM